MLLAGVAHATDKSKLPGGANHAAAHAGAHRSIGNNIRVGVIEIDGGLNTAKTTIDNDGRLIKDLNFLGLTAPVIAQPANAVPDPADNGDHATLVANVLASSNAVHTGVAKGARLYVAAVDTNPSMIAAIDWFHRQENVGVFNMSLGGNGFNASNNQAHTGVATSLNAGASVPITTNLFDFGAAANRPSAIHNIFINFSVNDGDTGAGDFDRDNLVLKIAEGPADPTPLILSGVLLNDFRDGEADNRSFSFNLSPADTATLTTKLNNTNGKLEASIHRLATAAGNDIGFGGNNLTPTNAVAGDAFMRIAQRNSADHTNNTQLQMFLDWHMNKKDTLIVKSAGNDGGSTRQITHPGDFYNGITVGSARYDATENRFDARAPGSSYWLTGDNGNAPDVRSKPDILAPGDSIGDGLTYGNSKAVGTSFATPHVTGVSAMIAAGTENGNALPLGTPGNHNHLAHKAIILNSARKRGIVGENVANAFARDNALTGGETSDEDYLNGGVLRIGGTPGTGAPPHPTRDWTPAKWSNAANGPFITTGPLDDEQGTGMLDAKRALIQLDGGEQGPGNVRPIGWDINTTPLVGFGHRYFIDDIIPSGSFITVTLTWDRIIVETEGDGSAGDGIVESTDVYSFGSMPNLDLRILYAGSVVAQSSSTVDNVEHLHIPVSVENPAVGGYSIQVTPITGSQVPYALAWWTVPEPGSIGLTLIGLTCLVMTRRRSEA